MRRGPWRALAFLAVGAIIGGVAGYRAPHWLDRNPVPEGLPTPRPEGPEWIDLLGPAHAPGWKNLTDEKEIFEIRDGELHIFGRSLLPLRYVGYAPERFGDFDLHIEFKMARRANSGVFLRVQPDDPVYRGFEVQVLDDHGRPANKNGTGAIYDVVTPMFNPVRRAGDWNAFDITVQGTHVSVHLNGWKVIDTDFSAMAAPLGKFSVPYADLPREGLLALQDHGGEVWYRNILIRRR